MFFPREMTEVELIIPSKDLVSVTKVLSGRGVFHQVDSAYLGVEGIGPSTWQAKATDYSTLERRIQVIMQTLNLVEEPRSSSDFGSMVELKDVQPAVDRIENDVKGTSDQLIAEKKRLEMLESQIRQIEPISHINFEVGALRNSTHMHSILGVMPTAQMSRLETSLARVPHVFFELKKDSRNAVVWLLGPKTNFDVLERAAKSAYINPLTLPEEFSGTPAEITVLTRKAIEESKQKIFAAESKLSKFSGTHNQELQKLWWEVHVSRLMADAIARFGQLRHTYVVVGWVPTDALQGLMERIKQA